MLRWRFSAYETPSGRPEVQDDVDRFDDAGVANFETKVRYLAGTTSPGDWTEPQAKKLKGASGLYEIRFKANRCATRAIGFFGPNDDEFTILIIATHKQDVYKPHNAFETAISRRAQVLRKEAGTSPLKIDGEVFPPTDEDCI